MALALLALLAQPALAQGGLGSVVLDPSPDARSAEPGGKVLFRVQATNRHILEQNVAFVATPPAGWAFNFTPTNLTLPAGASGNVTLEVFLPDDATRNQTVSLPLVAHAQGADHLVLGTSSVNVTVLERRAGSTSTQPPAAIALGVSVSDSSGAPGETVEGFVTLRNDGASTLDVALAGNGPAGWNPRFLNAEQFQVIYPGGTPRVVRVYASVPATASPNTTHDLAVVATAEGQQVPATWRISVVPPERPDLGEGEGGEPANASTGTGGQGGDPQIPVIEPERRTSLDLRMVDPLLQVAPGDDARGLLRLENTGTVPLRLRLVGNGPTDWPAPVLDLATLDLPAGAVTEVGFTLTAPADVIPSTTGRGAGSVMATSEVGLARTARFEVMVVPPAPADDSDPEDSETNAARIESGEGFNVPTATIGIAAAFGAVGAGAVAIANRPMREKLFWAGVGLYTRLARPDVLGHEDREKLYRMIEGMPGVHFHALQRDLGWNTGTLTYHVRVLERHGFVVSRRDGLYRRFYLSGAAPRKEVFENQGPQGLRADVLEAIRNRHGMSQSDLALALGANKQTVNYHVKALERQGVIRLVKRGRETFLYPADAPTDGGREASA